MTSPECVLQFGTGMLLRAIVVTAVDTANRAGHFDGRIVVVRSTRNGVAEAINRQRGRFRLIELGIEAGGPVRRERTIDAISRALPADTEWQAIRDVAVRPELRVIVSNVTEAGFRLADREPLPARDHAQSPASFPAKLVDLLYSRFMKLRDAPLIFVIPTELVADNGPRLAVMVDTLARRFDRSDDFRAWIAARVRFCSSLVDRITTAMPQVEAPGPAHAPDDALVTVTEPHSLWAIECDPVALRGAFPVDAASGGTVIFAPDITLYRERKLRMLNGAHTALAPLAFMAGVRTVREAMSHAELGPFCRQMLLDEIAPSTDLPPDDAAAYAQSVLDRFANPWLDHEWRVILANQTAKLRLRVVPSIVAFVDKFDRVPDRLARALAASLRYARATASNAPPGGEGWWRGTSYRIVDVDLDLINRHWLIADSTAAAVIPDAMLARLAASVLGDAEIWGRDLTAVPEVVGSVARALMEIEHSSG